MEDNPDVEVVVAKVLVDVEGLEFKDCSKFSIMNDTVDKLISVEDCVVSNVWVESVVLIVVLVGLFVVDVDDG